VLTDYCNGCQMKNWIPIRFQIRVYKKEKPIFSFSETERERERERLQTTWQVVLAGNLARLPDSVNSVDSVLFRSNKIIRSYSNFAQNGIRSHSDLGFGLIPIWDSVSFRFVIGRSCLVGVDSTTD
jgi:hypothetical protein